MSSLGTLSAGMAHEIKNPLSSIKGMTQILKENINDSDFIDKYMAIVLRQIDRINSIVENLLKLGKPTKKTFENVNLKELFSSILALVENECRKKSIEIKKELKDVFAQVHPESLNQAFLNVLLNAIDAMQNGGTLSLSLDEKDGKIEIVIEDTGEGILKENLQKIFDPFFTTKEKGTGLGLSVFYKAIKENGGDVSVESGKGEGTRFNIWLYTKHKGS